ncbi:hypothetical protein EN918_03530, partial [Mesorhizobium sp. M7A.F.Ca.CA.004.05.1.1]
MPAVLALASSCRCLTTGRLVRPNSTPSGGFCPGIGEGQNQVTSTPVASRQAAPLPVAALMGAM